MSGEEPRIGDRVRAWRLHGGMTQAQVESLAGCSHNTISRIESGEVRWPRLETLTRIADALSISLEQLQFGMPRLQSRDGSACDAIDRLVEALRALPDDRRDGMAQALLHVVSQVSHGT